MTTTTAPELLAVADRRARDLIASDTAITVAQWEAFDDTLYRLLHTLVGPGRRLNGSDPGATRAVITTLQAYPQPFRPARGETYSAAEAARLLGVPRDRIARQLRNGDLTHRVVERESRIDADQLDTRPDLTPASATDADPLARLAVTLGGLADLLTASCAHADPGAGGRPTNDQEAAATIRHVMSIASVTARQAITHLPIADADRPLRIAQYAERAVNALAGFDAYPQLWEVASVHPRPTTDTIGGRLEAAVEEWALAARDDLTPRIPSSDVLRNIITTGDHVLATTDATLQHLGTRRSASADIIGALTAQLRTTGLALHAAAAAWKPVTTAMTPSPRYVAAARDVFTALDATQGALASRTPNHPTLDVEAALRTLTFATRPLSAQLVTIDELSRQLLGSHVLFIRARAVPPRAEIIHDRAKGRLIVARPQDLPNLIDATCEARKHLANLSARMRDMTPALFGPPESELTIHPSGLAL